MAAPGITESLEEKLKKQQQGATRMIRGAGGQLEEVSGEEVSTLASKLGQQTPTTPLGTSGMGATPDQAKMAGTPAQTGAALQGAAAPAVDVQAQATTEQTQAGAQRLHDPSQMQASAAQQAILEKSQNLQNLGALGDRIYKMILGEAATGAQAGAEQNARLELDAEGIVDALPSTATAEQKQEVTNLLTQLEEAARAGDSATVQKLYETLARPPYSIDAPHTYLSDNAASAVAKSVPDLQTIAAYNQSGQLDAVAKQLGYSDFSQVAELLGISPEEMQNYKISELNDLIQNELDREFSETEKLKQVAMDPNASPQMQAEARARLRELGVVGIRASEAEVDALRQEMEAGTTVTIGDNQYTIEELFADENITSIAQDFLDMDEEERAEFAKEQPELAALFSKHEAVLKDAAEALGEEYAGFQRQQEANRKSTEALSSAIPPDIFKSTFLNKDNPVGSFLSQFFGPEGEPLASASDINAMLEEAAAPQTDAAGNAITTFTFTDPNDPNKTLTVDKSVMGVLRDVVSGKYTQEQIAGLSEYLTEIAKHNKNPFDYLKDTATLNSVLNLSADDRKVYLSAAFVPVPDSGSISSVDTFLDGLLGQDYNLQELWNSADSGFAGAKETRDAILDALGGWTYETRRGKKKPWPSTGYEYETVKVPNLAKAMQGFKAMSLADKIKATRALQSELGTTPYSSKTDSLTETAQSRQDYNAVDEKTQWSTMKTVNQDQFDNALDKINNDFLIVSDWTEAADPAQMITGAAGKRNTKILVQAIFELQGVNNKGADAIKKKARDTLGNIARSLGQDTSRTPPSQNDIDRAKAVASKLGMNDAHILGLLKSKRATRAFLGLFKNMIFDWDV